MYVYHPSRANQIDSETFDGAMGKGDCCLWGWYNPGASEEITWLEEKTDKKWTGWRSIYLRISLWFVDPAMSEANNPAFPIKEAQRFILLILKSHLVRLLSLPPPLTQVIRLAWLTFWIICWPMFEFVCLSGVLLLFWDMIFLGSLC